MSVHIVTLVGHSRVPNIASLTFKVAGQGSQEAAVIACHAVSFAAFNEFFPQKAAS